MGIDFGSILENILPSVWYLINRHKIILIAKNPNIGKADGPFSRYYKLDEAKLIGRIQQEHQRAISIDDKTVKFTLSLSIALTILATIGNLYTGQVVCGPIKLALTIMTGLSTIYALIAGISSLGALKTLPTYGYGTDFLIDSISNKEEIVHSLVMQEKMNVIRQLRNESSYQCLRNALLLLIITILIFITAQALGLTTAQ